MKTILCVGTSRLSSEGAAALLEQLSDGGIRAVPFVAGDPCALDAAADIALIDLPATRGLECVQRIRMANPRIQVIAVVDPALEDEVLAYARTGVEGYFTSGYAPDQIANALLNDGPAVAAPIHSILLREIAQPTAPEFDNPNIVLTPREVQVLTLIDKGLSNKEIARTLCVELTTVKNHVHQILSKTRARRRTQAVRVVRTHIERHTPRES